MIFLYSPFIQILKILTKRYVKSWTGSRVLKISISYLFECFGIPMFEYFKKCKTKKMR